MTKTHILAHDSEILSKGKTLDKKLKEIETKVDNIDVDGTLIATESKLGNVKIGEGVDIATDGTISSKLKPDTLNVTGAALPSGAKVKMIDGSSSSNTAIKGQTGKLFIEAATNSSQGVVYASSSSGLSINNGALSIPKAQISISTTSAYSRKFTLEENPADSGLYIITITDGSSCTNILNHIKSACNALNLSLALTDNTTTPSTKLQLKGFFIEQGEQSGSGSNIKYDIILKHENYTIVGNSHGLSVNTSDFSNIFGGYPV